MNQTVTANISGMVFHIEVDAYETLKNYLNKIKGYFHNSEESAEIMADIEARIAELFNARLSSKIQVITARDVDEVITVMGRPEQYVDNEESESTTQPNNDRRREKRRRNKRIFRDPDNRVFGGVAGGLGAYFGIEPVWLRLIWAISILFFGFGFLPYIILWIIIPEAKSASDKLEMKGEPVNFKNIGKTFEDEAGKVRDKFRDMDNTSWGQRIETGFRTFFKLLGVTLMAIFKLFGKFLGVIFLIIGIVLIVTMAAGFAGSSAFSIVSDNGFFSADLKELFVAFLGTESQLEILRYTIMGVVGIPIIALIYGSFRLLFGFRGNAGIGGGLAAIWMICLVALAVIGVQIGSNFQVAYEVDQKLTLNDSLETIYLMKRDGNIPGEEIARWDDGFLSLTDSMIFYSLSVVEIEKSKDDSSRVYVTRVARGSNRSEAKQFAEEITYTLEQQQNRLLLDGFVGFDRNEKWHVQHVIVRLELPIGKAVYIDQSTTDVLFDIDHVHGMSDEMMMGHTWIMTSKGLRCADCEETTSE